MWIAIHGELYPMLQWNTHFHAQFILTTLVHTGQYLAQMCNVPDLPQNKEPVHPHFYPKTFRFRKQKPLVLSVQVRVQNYCPKAAGQNKIPYTYHAGIKASQRPHFTFSKSKEFLKNLNISKEKERYINYYNLPQ